MIPKYRVWDKNRNKTGELIEISEPIYLDKDTMKEFDDEWLVHDLDYRKKITIRFDDYVQTKIFDKYKIKFLQYLGLKDINGKELYDGDIIQVEDYDETFNVVVSIIAEGLEVVGADLPVEDAENYEMNYTINDILDLGHFEIIGNEYENPDLLTEK